MLHVFFQFYLLLRKRLSEEFSQRCKGVLQTHDSLIYICVCVCVRARSLCLIIHSDVRFLSIQPKIDNDHPSWLHLRIREFDPKFNTSKARSNHLKMSNHVADGKWTLGFPTAKACEAARLLILEETSKQRSFVEGILAPLLQDDYLGNLSDVEDE